MPDVLIDTDVFVDHLRGARRLPMPPGAAYYSAVTRAELFAGRHVDEDLVRRLLEPFVEIPVSRAVAEEAGRLRRTSPIRMPDALIAASALLGDLTLWTRNAHDLEGVTGLSAVAP